MAAELRGSRSLFLYELLGAPLAAVVQAEATAARTTLEFIGSVGMIEQDDGESRMRMATFRYSKLDENNQPSDFVASIPLLALVPIPALQVKEAKITLAAKILDTTVEPEPAKPAQDAPSGPIAKFTSWLLPRRANLVTKPAASSGGASSEDRTTYHLDIVLTLGQADSTIGLEKVLSLMDQAVQDRKADAPAPVG